MLPLDDPRWKDLETDGYPISRMLGRLELLHVRGELGIGRAKSPDAFDFTAGTLHQGTIYTSAFAVIPHVVHVAEKQSHMRTANVWTWLGILASAHRRTCRDGEVASEGSWSRSRVPEFLVADYRDALARAEQCAIACLLEAKISAIDTTYLALATVALGGHAAGRFLWTIPEEPHGPLSLFARIHCPECDAETELLNLPDGVAPLCGPEDPPRSADPSQPPVRAPRVDLAETPSRAAEAWAGVARVLAGAHPDARVLDRSFHDAAHLVAERGVPESAPERAVLSLVATLIAIHGHNERARAIARLAGEVKCPECSEVSPYVDCVW